MFSACPTSLKPNSFTLVNSVNCVPVHFEVNSFKVNCSFDFSNIDSSKSCTSSHQESSPHVYSHNTDNSFVNQINSSKSESVNQADSISNRGADDSKTLPESSKQSSRVTEITSEKVKCFYTNADQLRNKIDELKLQIVLEHPDFIFVTEVLPKVNSDVNCSSVLYQIDGYNTFPSQDGNRGVIIYARSDFNVSPNVYLNDIYSDASWCDWIVDNKKVLLGAIYRSPSSNDSCVTINRLLSEAANLSQNLLITGDFNMKDINWGNYTTIHSETHYEYNFIECIRDNFLFQHISDFARIRENQNPHILDLVFTNRAAYCHLGGDTIQFAIQVQQYAIRFAIR